MRSGLPPTDGAADDTVPVGHRQAKEATMSERRRIAVVLVDGAEGSDMDWLAQAARWHVDEVTMCAVPRPTRRWIPGADAVAERLATRRAATARRVLSKEVDGLPISVDLRHSVRDAIHDLGRAHELLLLHATSVDVLADLDTACEVVLVPNHAVSMPLQSTRPVAALGSEDEGPAIAYAEEWASRDGVSVIVAGLPPVRDRSDEWSGASSAVLRGHRLQALNAEVLAASAKRHQPTVTEVLEEDIGHTLHRLSRTVSLIVMSRHDFDKWHDPVAAHLVEHGGCPILVTPGVRRADAVGP